jgi:hypothetical protein
MQFMNAVTSHLRLDNVNDKKDLTDKLSCTHDLSSNIPSLQLLLGNCDIQSGTNYSVYFE